MNEKVVKHKAICDELNALYARKNHDYGDSFHQTFVEEGMAMPRIRLGDKFSRFKTLTQSGGQQVTDESIRDTLMDLANYAIMTILEMEQEEYVTLYANGEPYMTLKKEGKPDVQTGTDPQKTLRSPAHRLHPAGHVPGGRRHGHGLHRDDCCADVLRKGKLDSWRLS